MKKRRRIWPFVLLSVFLVLGITAAVLLKTHEITEVRVDGNVHYTDEEIAGMVLTNRLSYNSLYLSLKYRNKSVEGVPFVEKMDVSIVSPHEVRINVYEKALAGYIAYLDRYLYFDREGILVESASFPTANIPEVLGLDFSHAVLYEKLPVENESVFSNILNITQLLKKYDLSCDRIYFDASYEVFLYFDEVEVSFGAGEDLEDKIIRLQYILPSLAGRRGILKMRDYDSNTNNITFEEME